MGKITEQVRKHEALFHVLLPIGRGQRELLIGRGESGRFGIKPKIEINSAVNLNHSVQDSSTRDWRNIYEEITCKIIGEHDTEFFITSMKDGEGNHPKLDDLSSDTELARLSKRFVGELSKNASSRIPDDPTKSPHYAEAGRLLGL